MGVRAMEQACASGECLRAEEAPGTVLFLHEYCHAGDTLALLTGSARLSHQ